VTFSFVKVARGYVKVKPEGGELNTLIY
jgi:hypothetical protein